MDNTRARSSPSPPPKEPSGYWALPTAGRWRSDGFNKLEDEELGSSDQPMEHASSRTAADMAASSAPASAPSTPGSVKKQRSLKAAKAEKGAGRGNSIYRIPNFSTNGAYSRIEADTATEMSVSPPRSQSFSDQHPQPLQEQSHQEPVQRLLHHEKPHPHAPALIAFSPPNATPMQVARDGESDTDTVSSYTIDRADTRSQALSSHSLNVQEPATQDTYSRVSACSNSSSPDVVAIADNPAASAPVSYLDAAAARAHLMGHPPRSQSPWQTNRQQSMPVPSAGSLSGPAVPVPVPRVAQPYRRGGLGTRSQPAMGTQHLRNANGHAAHSMSNGHSNGTLAQQDSGADSWNIFEPQAAPVPKMTSASSLRTGRHTRDFVILKCMRGKDLLQVMAQGMPMRKKWVTSPSNAAGSVQLPGKVKPMRLLRLTLNDGLVSVRYHHQGTRGLMNKEEVSAVVEHAEVTDGPWHRGQEIWMFTDRGTLALEAPDASSHATWTFGLNTAFAASQTRRRDYIENCIVKTIPRSESMIFKESSSSPARN